MYIPRTLPCGKIKFCCIALYFLKHDQANVGGFLQQDYEDVIGQYNRNVSRDVLIHNSRHFYSKTKATINYSPLSIIVCIRRNCSNLRNTAHIIFTAHIDTPTVKNNILNCLGCLL